MSISKVKEYFKKYNIEKRILEFSESSATVELAAQRLNIEPGMIAKSLTFKLNDKPIMIVAAGDKKIDNAKYKNEFHTKAKMLTKDEVSNLIGHDVGGVCPFAINDGVMVFLDISLKEYKTIFPACGSDNSAIELTIDELEKYSNYKRWIDVCK